MQHTLCNYCGNDNSELVNQGLDLYLNRPENHTLVRCKNCGLIYQNPKLQEDELLAHYPTANYELYSQPINNEKSPIRRADRQLSMIRRYRRIMKHTEQPGHILDIGCATGSFIAIMRDQGWEVSGVELNPEVAQYARTVLNLNVHPGTLEQAGFSDDSFDVVTMWDVFEHVLNPKATLKEIVRILKPGGTLVISVPNPSSLEARIFGANWAGWDRPRHLHLFTPAVLKRYLKDAGFAKIEIDSFGGRLSVTLLSVSYACNARQIPEEKWRPWIKFLYNWPVRLLTWPFYRLGEAINQTTNMTMFARLCE